jgi:hypothetical protein
MKRKLYLISGLVAMFLGAAVIPWLHVRAQQGVPGTLVQQSPTMLNACTPSNKSAAVNNAVTVSLTPPNGLFTYICGIDLTVSEDATGLVAQTNASFTSTNLGGWAYEFSTTAALNTTPVDKNFYFPTPVKSAQPGVAVTVVSPAANTHAAYNVNVYYYFAP